MLATALALALTLQSPAPDTLRTASPAAIASAYLDPSARETLRLARQRREVVDRSITAYRVTARERFSAGLRALRRDRTLFRREIAARILWRRDGVGRVEVLGARQVTPGFAREASVPDEAGADAAGLAFDPADLLLLRGFGEDDEALRNPLAPGSEQSYRFASGDTTRLRLADGRTIRLVELRVLPRRGRGRLQGSFWLDADTHAPVRASLRLSRPLDLLRDLDDEGEDDDVPAVLRPIQGDLRLLTIDYALWGGRWWLPRLIAIEGEASAGGTLRVPLRFERSYADYEVEGEGSPPLVLSAADTLLPPAGQDSAGAVSATRSEARVQPGGRRRCREEPAGCWEYAVEQPADTVLLRSEYLADSPFGDDPLIPEAELRELAGVFGAAVPGQLPWQRPTLRWSYLNPTLLRYNRVEGLALGGRVEAGLGPAAADATLWLPTANLEPGVELGVRRSGFAAAQRLAAYRRLEAVDPDPRALGFGASLAALLLGRDDADYYRTLGVELSGEPAGSPLLRYRWRLFAERQTAAEKRTDLSLPGLFDGRDFRANLTADRAEQVGGELSLAAAGGRGPAAWRWGGEVGALASVGDHRFARPSASAYLGFPLPFALTGVVEAAGGTAAGRLPAQSRWYLGGPATVRGYGGDSRLAGDAFWRSRVEIGTGLPAARLALFSDAGWAGRAADLTWRPPLLSAGAGLSFLDGLLRVDLARALRGHRAWRLDLHLDALM